MVETKVEEVTTQPAIKENGSLTIADVVIDKDNLFGHSQVTNEFLKILETIYAQKITGGQFIEWDIVKEFYENFVAELCEYNKCPLPTTVAVDLGGQDLNLPDLFVAPAAFEALLDYTKQATIKWLRAQDYTRARVVDSIHGGLNQTKIDYEATLKGSETPQLEQEAAEAIEAALDN